MSRKRLGVLIGRFQIHQLTEGHKYLFAQVAGQCQRVLALLGVPPISSRRRDPLEYALRARMLQDYWDDAYPAGPELIVVPCLDCPLDTDWVRQIDNTITALAPNTPTMVYCGPDGCGPMYKNAGGFWPVEILEAIPGHATEHRAALTPRHTEDFRAGVIYATERRFLNPYPVVDVAVFRPLDGHVLLAQKKIDQTGRWRLIGGFVDVADASFEHAVKREVREETGIEVDNLRYVGSARVPDWRYRGTPEGLTSAVFIASYVFGIAAASDDIHRCQWLDPERMGRDWDIADNHRALWQLVKAELHTQDPEPATA